MDIFSNRAGVELLRPTVYLKQITPGDYKYPKK